MPPFVLEVVSASSVQCDLEEKTELYRILGVREYAIVRLDLDDPRLEGYRQTARGAWEAWARDGEGRLWSEVLDLGLVLRGVRCER
jgi:Uma2 family endonuclease